MPENNQNQPHKEDEILFAAYDRHYQRMGNMRPSKEIHQDNIRDFAKPWATFLSKEAPILDVGCGYGHQLYALHLLGFINLTGIEISDGAYQAALHEVGSFASISKADAFDFLKSHQNAYDLIILYDVLEHIPREQTLDLMQLIFDALRPNGIIAIRVPNMASLLSNYSLHIDFTHRVGFTEFSLMQILDQIGFHDHRIIRSSPKLFTNGHTFLAVLRRLLAMTRFWLNEFLHLTLYALRGQRPKPTTFAINLEVYSRKPQRT